VNIADDIKRLHELHQAGALTDAEFAQAKAKLLSSVGSGASSQDAHSNSFSGIDDSLNQLNRFRRSNTDRWLGGICGGLGKFIRVGILDMAFAVCLFHLLFWRGSGRLCFSVDFCAGRRVNPPVHRMSFPHA
jgi:hypothetical protein